MHIEFIQFGRNIKISQWLRVRLSSMFARDTVLWRFAFVSTWLLSCTVAIIAVMGMPTGFGTGFDVITGLLLNSCVMIIFSISFSVIFSLIRLSVPRFTAGGLVYLGLMLYLLLYFSEFGWIEALALSIVFTGSALGLGLLVGAMVCIYLRYRLLFGMVAAVAAVTISALWFSLTSSAGVGADQTIETVAINSQDMQYLPRIHLDPSEPGEYSYSSFTYGNGKDQHRTEFADDVGERSTSVDASAYIKSWPWLREKFWGFDQSQLPLNGRVWMPEGEGPFPIILMVHGNHLMEEFSDEGYNYLGELLASRGTIAISIDENFLNYSVWSGIPEQDMKLRAWLLLKHIGQLQQYNKQADSLFYGRIDFQQSALLGHSRGGQAAAMAADRSLWFSDDLDLPDMESYSIQAVIALAPTDTKVDGKQATLKNVSYLTLHGAKDTDLMNFYGGRQYGRVKFTAAAEQFKASLYIEDANHNQFNTMWGESDHSLPASLFIRNKELLKAEHQRQVAKMYVSAFLETLFHGSGQFELLFRDYRNGLNFLPATQYFNQYESSSFRRLADVQGEERKLLSSGFGGSYSLQLNPSSITNIKGETILMFSLANMGTESNLSIAVEVEDRSKNAARLSLDPFMEIASQVKTDFIWLPGLESVLFKGKFKDEEEPVFQTYEIPLHAFQEINPSFDLSEWSSITFYLNEGPGKLLLDDLGLMPTR